MRKVFLEDLPHSKSGKQILWRKCTNCKVKFIYDEIEGVIEILNVEMGKSSATLYVNYLNDSFIILSGNFVKCKIGNLLNKYTSSFKVEVNTILKDDKRDIIITDREYKPVHRLRNSKNIIENRKRYRYTCNKCGWTEGWIDEGNLLNQKQGCSCCKGISIVEGINDISTIAPWMIPYFQGGVEEAKLYTKSGGGNPNNKGGKIYPKCPDCGRVKDKKINISSIYKNKSIGCICGDGQSYPNKLAFSILEQLEIDFIIEYSPEWCKFLFKENIRNGRYDFYFKLINNEYILEMDGGWHNKDNNQTGQTCEESKIIDSEKDKLAKEHGIEVIRINCSKSDLNFIKESMLNSKLNEIVNLDKVNWTKSEEFALSSLVKKVCEHKRDNPEMTTSDLGIVMGGLARSTVRNYLKKGSTIWDWCEYDEKEESIKTYVYPPREIEIYKDNILLETYNSMSELIRKVEKSFGIKLSSSNICKVCCGERNHHKGFNFKYASINIKKESQ